MTTINQAPTYNLGVVLQETGINADTLRAWERRYGMPQPARSEGGHRLYSQHDMDTIKWLISRQDEGMSISKAINLWRTLDAEGKNPLQELPSRIDAFHVPTIEVPVGAKIQDLREQWVNACLAFDENNAEQIINHSFALFPAETVCFDILFSGLSQIGDAWYQSNATVQQEHFASALVTRRIIALIAAAPPPIQNQSIVVGCPPNEGHELPALLIAYLLRSHGWRVVYLGANVPLGNFEETVVYVSPDLMILVAQTLHTAAYLKEVALALKSQDFSVAFGGLIFNRLPVLAKQIPGFFLGQDLRQALPLVEKMLTSSHSKQPKTVGAAIDYETLAYFSATRPVLEEKLFGAVGKYMPSDYLQIANHHMAENMAAGIKLGNIDYLGAEIDWIKGLLSNANYSDDLLAEYLNSYYQVAEQVFDERGEVIVNWMAKVSRQLRN